MILYSVYNIVIHITFLFLSLSILFETVIKTNIQYLFDDKTKAVKSLFDHKVYIEDKKAINDRWWKTIYILNGVFIATSVIMTGLLSYISKKHVFNILVSNTISSIIVIIIQLIIIEFIKFSSLGPVDFELIILDELKNKL